MTSDDDTKRQLFADLTALFEDAAELSANGQALGLTDRVIFKHVRAIRRQVERATEKLDHLIRHQANGRAST